MHQYNMNAILTTKLLFFFNYHSSLHKCKANKPFLC